MKTILRTRKYIFTCLLLFFFFAVLAQVETAIGAPQKSQTKNYVAIDFNNVDINLFIKYISEITKKNFIVDRAVKGNVTILSPSQIALDDAYKVFESVLEVHGFTTIPSGSVTKIVPIVQARSKNIATLLKDRGSVPDDRVVTQVIALTHTDANEVKAMLAPLVSKASLLIPYASSGILIITDVQSNIVRLREIIKAIDVPSVTEKNVTIELQYADAITVAKSIRELFIKKAVKGGALEHVKVIPYERTNSLIVTASKANLQKIYNLLDELDKEVVRGEGNIRVYYLQHANAEELVKVLTSLPGSKTTREQNAKTAPVLSADIKVTADAETNALIITAPREEYYVLEDVIKKLDIPRRMVYLEALIMEVQVTKDFALGVQWSNAKNSSGGAFFGGFSSNENKPYNLTGGMRSNPPVLPAGFTLGYLKQGIQIGDLYFPDLSAVINAYKSDDDINIIATPQILTTDNKEAAIKVGENIPYITSLNTTDSSQDYTNYEYKDVATSLTITPQINQADVVRLDIGVEVIKLKDPGATSGTPTTLTRTADTTVIVHNEETVVLGGIIGQDTQSSEYKVPFLGDLPLLGWLFKSQGDDVSKTNLFIFITPHIVENPAELAAIYYEKRDVMESVQPGSSDIPDQFFYKKSNPSHAAALTDIGFTKLQRNEYAEAKQYFLQALNIDPDNPYATINLGVVYEKEGNEVAAREMYQRIVELDVPDVEENGEPQDPYDALRELAQDNLRHLQSSSVQGQQ